MEMDERARQVLKEDLGLPDEEIEAIALAEKQKALPEANVVEKSEEKPTLLTRVGELLIRLGTAKEVKVEEEKKVEAPVEPVEQEKAEAQEVVETEKVEKVEKGPEMAITGEVVKAVSEQVAKNIGTMLGEEIAKVMGPLQEKIATLEAQVFEANKSVEEKVEERLAELPKIVTIQASATEATKAEASMPERSKTADLQFLDDIKKVIANEISARVNI